VLTDDVPVNHPGAVVLLSEELITATLDTGMGIVIGIEAPKCTAWDVRDLELLRPLRRSGREPRVHRSERGDDLVGERVFRHHEDVDIAAVLREIGRERTVEIHADELRPERAAHTRKQLREHRVDVGVAGRMTHRCHPDLWSHPGDVRDVESSHSWVKSG